MLCYAVNSYYFTRTGTGAVCITCHCAPWRLVLVPCAGALCRCVRLAAARTPDLAGQIEAALKQHELARVQARVRRQTGTAAAAAAAAAGPGHLPGQQEPTGGCRGAAAAATAAAAAVAAGGVGGRDARNITVLTDADMAGQKLQELMQGRAHTPLCSNLDAPIRASACFDQST